VAAVAANLLIAPRDPEVVRAEIRERLRATEEPPRAAWGRGRGARAAVRDAGVTRLLACPERGTRARLRPSAIRSTALITPPDRLVTAAATWSGCLPSPRRGLWSRSRLRALACVAFDARRTAELGNARPSGVAVLDELEQAVDQLQQALGPEGKTALATGAEAERPALLVKDAFTNPDHLRYALKGALAVMICYVLMSAVDWPGIRTCIVTCLIVGLGSEGATIQKGSLRITGALVGAAMGFAAIMLLIPGMDSITSLALLVAAGTAVAGRRRSPRIAYVGCRSRSRSTSA
jgi:hypothetical protein